ncbi:MAG: LytR/AlgR family response regulator transcription factor [Solirubrobacterales bacterium]
MLYIIICEDNNIQRKQLENIITEEINNSKLDLSIILSTSNPKEVVKHIALSKDNNFIYFLDVELNSYINGIELANIIRKYDPKGYIIFVTSHAELTLLTFEYKVQAMDYILKSNGGNLKVKIVECLRAACSDFKKTNDIEKKYFSIDIGNRIVNVQPDKILFFETDKDHRIRLRTFDENIEFYCSLKEIEKILPPYFYRCHRSYIVNTRNIKSIDKDKLIVNMTNGDKCYLSKHYKKGIIISV